MNAEAADEFALVGVREELYQELWARWPEPAREGHLSESPFVSLDELRASGESYLSHLSSNTRSQVRRAVRLYGERFGEPEVRAACSSQELYGWFDSMASLHAKRWHGRGKSGAFGDAKIRDFHLGLLKRVFHGQAKELRAEILRVSFGAEAIAYLYQLRYRGRVNFYQSGLAYHGDNRLKPGLVAHALAVEHYLTGGESEYDFLGGEPEAVRYKRSLATSRRMLAWIELPSPNAKMRVLRGARLAWRGIRSLLERRDHES
ncbi:MAG: GNAT family N-acetyltransferase [Longimicrobiales bacterium]